MYLSLSKLQAYEDILKMWEKSYTSTFGVGMFKGVLTTLEGYAGICGCIRHLYYSKLISHGTFHDMLNEIAELPRIYNGYCWTLDESGKEARIEYLKGKIEQEKLKLGTSSETF